MSIRYRNETFVPTSKQDQLQANPPAALRLLIDDLFASKVRESNDLVRYITANEIAPEVLVQLNAFASSVARRPVKITAIHECSACYVGDLAGNLTTTEEGPDQCWACPPNA
jgi:hypothetical protein